MDWKSLWNKKYALIAFYFFLTALVYHICIRILDSFPVFGESIHRLFPWGAGTFPPSSGLRHSVSPEPSLPFF